MGLLEVHQLCSQRKFCWVKVIVTDRLSLRTDVLLSLVIFFCGICRWFSKSSHSDTCVIQSPCFCSCSRHLTSPHVELERISSIHADRRINHVVVGVDILCWTDYWRSTSTLSTSPSPVLTEVLTRCIYQSDCAAAAVVMRWTESCVSLEARVVLLRSASAPVYFGSRCSLSGQWQWKDLPAGFESVCNVCRKASV